MRGAAAGLEAGQPPERHDCGREAAQRASTVSALGSGPGTGRFAERLHVCQRRPARYSRVGGTQVKPGEIPQQRTWMARARKRLTDALRPARARAPYGPGLAAAGKNPRQRWIPLNGPSLLPTAPGSANTRQDLSTARRAPGRSSARWGSPTGKRPWTGLGLIHHNGLGDHQQAPIRRGLSRRFGRSVAGNWLDRFNEGRTRSTALGDVQHSAGGDGTRQPTGPGAGCVRHLRRDRPILNDGDQGSRASSGRPAFRPWRV